SSTVWLSTADAETMRSAAIDTRTALSSAQRRRVKTSAGSAFNVGNLRVRGFGQPHRILHQFEPMAAFGGEDRFGMKLHRLDRQFAMTDAHDHSVFGFRRDLQTLGKRLAPREQRVIAAHLKLPGQSREHPNPAIPYGRGLAVHRVVQHAKITAEGLHDALQSQAYAEYRDPQPHG